ncbi:MAG TPA: hypothetical protein VN607_05045 [Gemmatimonadaceae bacterium]|nr:hypothetical protein [Gemmatimonadaceae bacterium]
MSSPLDHTITSAWEQEGQRIAPALDFRASALIVGSDPVAAAEVALGIARAQARRRRVCVADVVGELKPIEDLIPFDFEYGLMDAFFQGVSLNKVAYSVDPARNLLLLPSGPKPIDHDGILASPRWASLAAGFRDAGALLLVIAPEDAAGTTQAALATDGVVLVGETAPPAGAPLLAHARIETMEPMDDAAAPLSDADFSERFAAAPAGSSGATPADAHPTPSPPATVHPLGMRPVPFWVGIAAAAAVAIALATWAADRYIPRPGPNATAPLASGATADSAGGQAALPARGAPDSGTARMPNEPTTADVAAGTLVANPGDSAQAAAFTVAIAEVASRTGANVLIDEQAARGLPALTVSPEAGQSPDGPMLVVTGAFGSRAAADSLLRALRRRAMLKPSQGHVTSLPLTLLIQTGVARDQAAFFTHGYRLKGLPVYALLQNDGSVNLYAGAFDAVDAAQPLLYAFRANGDQPRVAYRLGRVF